MASDMTPTITSAQPIRIGLLGLEGYSLMSYASASEPFRAANLLSGQRLYATQALCLDRAAQSSQATQATNPEPIHDGQSFDLLFLIAGSDPFSIDHPYLSQWLRHQASHGVRLCGVSGGPVVLAKAGLMGGYRMTVHWEHAPKLQHMFPDLLLSRSIYVVDRARLTCAGGIAAFDLAIALIAEHQGGELAEQVSDWFLHTEFRDSRADLTHHRNLSGAAHHTAVVRGLRFIDNNLAEPLGETQIAAHCNLSVRQLNRLFKADVGKTPMQVLREARMTLARRLLRQTKSKITQIALSAGFPSVSYFSQAYRAHYGLSPRQERAVKKE